MARMSKMQQRLAVPKHQRHLVGRSPFGSTGSSARVISAVKEDEIKPTAERYVVFMSQYAVRQYQFKPDDVLISINNPGDNMPCLATQPKAIQQLNYEAYPDFKDKQEGNMFDNPRAIQVAEFLKVNTGPGNIIVHCGQGEVRSVAMAAAIGSYFDLPVYTVSSNMKLIDRPQHTSAPIGEYAYRMFKAFDQFFED